MKSRISILALTLVPVALAVLLFGIFDFRFRKHLELERERRKAQWEREVREKTERFRTEATLDGWVNRLNYGFKREIRKSLARQPESAFYLRGEFFDSAARKWFPRSQFRHKPTILAFAVRPAARSLLQPNGSAGGNSGKGLVPLKGAFLESSRGRLHLFEDLAASLMARDAIGKSARIRLSTRVGALFGVQEKGFSFDLLYTFDLIWNHARGKALPVFYQGKSHLLLWDVFEEPIPGKGGKTSLGIYFLLVPIADHRQGNILRRALGRICASDPAGMGAFLVPIEARGDGVFVGRGGMEERRKSMCDVVRKLRGAGGREKAIPHGQCVEIPEQGVWIQRQLVSLNILYELWMVSPSPEFPARMNDPYFLSLMWGSLCFCLVPTLWFLVTGAPIPVTLTAWFRTFSFLFGVLGLLGLFVAGQIHISLGKFRKEQLAIKDVVRRIEGTDARSLEIFNRFTAECQGLFSDPGWTSRMVSDDSGIRRDVVKATFGKFRSSKLPLEIIMLMNGRGENFLFVPSGNVLPQHRQMLDFFLPYVHSTMRYLAPYSQPRMQEDWEAGVGKFLEAMNAFIGVDPYVPFLVSRGAGDLLEAGTTLSYSFHDFISTPPMPNGSWVMLRMNPRPLHEDFLIRRLAELNQRPDRAVFCASRATPGGQEPFFPPSEEGNFWESHEGRVLQRSMSLAAISGSELHFSLPEQKKAFVVIPGKKVHGFVLGAKVNLDPFATEEIVQTVRLCLLTLLLGIPILLLGYWGSVFLINPILSVESGLKRIIQGDLGVRVGLSRDDELGRMTQAFDSMIRGLETRVRLGRFVPGTLDASISRFIEDAAAANQDISAGILVSDIRGFTALSEEHPARAVVQMLNRHLEVMSREIQARKGLIDKFIGDAVVAVFPDDQPGSGRERAVEAAVGMMNALESLVEERRKNGEFPYSMGIGIDHGTVQVGVLHSAGRMEQVIMGLPRLQAEKLESLSRKGSHTGIVVSEAIVGSLKNLRFERIPRTEGFELAELDCGGWNQ